LVTNFSHIGFVEWYAIEGILFCINVQLWQSKCEVINKIAGHLLKMLTWAYYLFWIFLKLHDCKTNCLISTKRIGSSAMKIMIDNSTCLSANWIKFLQNSLVNTWHCLRFTTFYAITCTLYNVNLWNSTKSCIHWTGELLLWGCIVFEISWASSKCWRVFSPF
jgi:hypothetical protein